MLTASPPPYAIQITPTHMNATQNENDIHTPCVLNAYAVVPVVPSSSDGPSATVHMTDGTN